MLSEMSIPVLILELSNSSDFIMSNFSRGVYQSFMVPIAFSHFQHQHALALFLVHGQHTAMMKVCYSEGHSGATGLWDDSSLFH